MNDRDAQLRQHGATPMTLDAGLTGANAASGRCADFIRPPSSGKAAPAPVCTCSAPLTGEELADAYIVEIDEGMPSAPAWQLILACGGFDIASARAFLVQLDRDEAGALEGLLVAVEAEVAAAVGRLDDAYHAGGCVGSPQGCQLNNARSLLATARAWLQSDPGHSHLEGACGLLMELVTSTKQTGLALIGGTVAADLASLVGTCRNRFPAQPGDCEYITRILDVDARRLFRALAELREATTPGDLSLRHHAAELFDSYNARCAEVTR